MAGDLAYLFVGVEPVPAVYLPAFTIAQHVAAPFVTIPLGALAPDGTLVASFTSPLLAPGVEFARLPSQVVLVTSAPGLFHSGPSLVLIKAAGL